MARKILITGGNGKIGQELIKCLVNDLAIRVLTTKKNSSVSNRAEVVFGNLLEPSSLLEAVQDIDEIVHLAAITHSNNRDDYWRINVTGTKNLIIAAQQAKINRFIFVSTRAISSDGGAYSQSKLAAEEIVKKSGINWVILRPAEIYGMKQNEMVDRLIRFIRKSYLVPVIGKCSLAPVHINDVVNAMKKVIIRSDLVDKTYLLSGPDSFSLKELVDQICQFYKLKRLRIYCPVILLKIFFKTVSLIPGQSLLVYDQLPRLLSSKSIDISLSQKDLEFYPMDFQTGLSLLK